MTGVIGGGIRDSGVAGTHRRARARRKGDGFRSGPSNQADRDARKASREGQDWFGRAPFDFAQGRRGARPYGGCRGNPPWLPQVGSRQGTFYRLS